MKSLYGNTSLTATTNNELTSVHIQTSILEYFLIIEALEKVTHCVEFPWQALLKYLAIAIGTNIVLILLIRLLRIFGLTHRTC